MTVTVSKQKPHGEGTWKKTASFRPATERNPRVGAAWQRFEDKTEPHTMPSEIKPKTEAPDDENARIYRVDMKDHANPENSKSFTTHNGLHNAFHQATTALVDTTLDARSAEK